MFSAFNPIFQVVGVHPGRGGEGASNDGLQGLDSFPLSLARHQESPFWKECYHRLQLKQLGCCGKIGKGSLEEVNLEAN